MNKKPQPRSEARYRHQVTGKMNKARGKLFEELIEASCRQYDLEGKGQIEKTPEPMRVLQRMNDNHHFICAFEKKAQPDYKGTLNGGRAVVFEAKYTDEGRISQSAVTNDQAKRLERFHNYGAMSFVLVSFSFESFCRIPWTVWRDMKQKFGRKYLTCNEAEIIGKVPFTGSRILFLEKI